MVVVSSAGVCIQLKPCMPLVSVAVDERSKHAMVLSMILVNGFQG